MTRQDSTVPFGFCQCGCGQKTRLARQSVTRLGHIKGQPIRYVSGHHNRAPGTLSPAEYRAKWEQECPDVPYGYCQCGCGQKTNLATQSSAKFERVKGEPVRFVWHHTGCIAQRRRERIHEQQRREYREWWKSQTNVPYGYCWCGCETKTTISRNTTQMYGYVNGEPRRYVLGHQPNNTPFRGWLCFESGLWCKKCADCKRILPLLPDYFPKCSRSHSGYRSYCSYCHRAQQHARRALAAGTGGTYSFEDVWEILESQDHLCAWCETPLMGTYHVDHYWPISKGGFNGVENLVASCPACNISKGAKTPLQFLKVLGYSVVDDPQLLGGT